MKRVVILIIYSLKLTDNFLRARKIFYLIVFLVKIVALKYNTYHFLIKRHLLVVIFFLVSRVLFVLSFLTFFSIFRFCLSKSTYTHVYVTVRIQVYSCFAYFLFLEKRRIHMSTLLTKI